jgi:hypothetical protein
MSVGQGAGIGRCASGPCDETAHRIEDDPWEEIYRQQLYRDRLPVPRILQDQTDKEESWKTPK